MLRLTAYVWAAEAICVGMYALLLLATGHNVFAGIDDPNDIWAFALIALLILLVIFLSTAPATFMWAASLASYAGNGAQLDLPKHFIVAISSALVGGVVSCGVMLLLSRGFDPFGVVAFAMQAPIACIALFPVLAFIFLHWRNELDLASLFDPPFRYSAL